LCFGTEAPDLRPFWHDGPVGDFERETDVTPAGAGRWTVELTTAWDIGNTANGGYALSPVLRAMSEVGDHHEPLSVTTHFLRPVKGGGRVHVDAELVRQGRVATVARGQLTHDDRERLIVVAAFGDLSEAGGDDTGDDFYPSPPDMPSPDECLHRSTLEQGVGLPILQRLDVRIHPHRAEAGASSDAITEGWIRFADRSDPTAIALPLFADAFPPSLYSRFGKVGWVPTLELTVHVRRRPAPGWIMARLECDDLERGRMIESGTLWDSTGAVVARSRQLGLLLPS
jgi:acyl-CoA thioesterase